MSRAAFLLPLVLALGASAEEPLTATVVKVVGNRAALDVGARHGIEAEAVFRLYSPARIVRIPLTQTVTYQEEQPVATLVVNEVDARESWGEVDVFVEGAELRSGMPAVFSGYQRTVREEGAEVALEADSTNVTPGQWVRLRVSGAPEGSVFRWSASEGWLSGNSTLEPAVFWAVPERPGKARVSVKVETPDDKSSDTALEFEISDTGVSLPEKFTQRILSGRLLSSGEEPRVAGVAVEDGSVYYIDGRMGGLYLAGGVMGSSEIAGPNRGRPLRQPYAMAVHDGKAYILDQDFYRMKCYSLATGEQLRLMGKDAPTKETVDLAIGDSNLLYALDRGARRIHVIEGSNGQYRLSFGRKGREAGCFLDPIAIDVGPSGRVYVLDAEKNCVDVFDKAMSHKAAFPLKLQAGNRPVDLAVSAAGVFYVLEGPRTGLIKYSITGRLVARSGEGAFPSLPEGAAAVSSDASGKVYVVPGNRAGIVCYSPAGEYLGAHALSGARPPIGIAVAPGGSFALHYLEPPLVEVYNSSGWLRASWGEPFQKPVRFTVPGRLAFRPDGVVIYAMGPGNLKSFYTLKQMYHVLSFTTNGKLLGHFGGRGEAYGRFIGQQDMTVDRSGAVWVLDDEAFRVSAFADDPNQPLVRNLVRGKRERHEIASPTLLAVDPGGESFYIFDERLAAVKRFDRDGNIMSLVNVRNLRPRVAEAVRIAAPYKGILALLDRARNAVYFIDFTSAEPRLVNFVQMSNLDARLKDMGVDAACRILAVSDRSTVYVLSRF